MNTNKPLPPRPFLKWLGGKRQLLPALVRAVEQSIARHGPIQRYHEPFLGGGALFFGLAERGLLGRGSFICDVNANLIDAYLGIQRDVEGVIECLRAHAARHAQAYYYEVRASEPRNTIERAARIIYLNRTGYNGLYRENRKGKFNVPFGRYKNPRILDAENLRRVAAVLSDAEIRAADFHWTLTVARPGDLVYFDPPYHPISKTSDFTSYSRDGFGEEGQRALEQVARELVARGVHVIASNSMTEFTRELYADFAVGEIQATRRINSKADRRGPVPEAIFTSFPVDWEALDVRSLSRHPRLGAANDGARETGAVITRAIDSDVESSTAREWLIRNGHDDVAERIDIIERIWRSRGNRTRRSWWRVLAGTPSGRPRTVAGYQFPVINVARERFGMPPIEP
jgi:DNA adenine methylase